jgi:hypothetical protein
MTSNGLSIDNIINIESEDNKTKISLTITNNGTIFKIFEMKSPPQILLLTLSNTVSKLKELKIENVCNLINKNEIDMFEKKKIKYSFEDSVLIEIKTDDFLNEMTKVFGINDLVL